ncbi:MAG: hypothetical protein JWO06_235 [Bacteroidota bacterium]|nr:hypothetical protein [Bacteroidota bacterium]
MKRKILPLVFWFYITMLGAQQSCLRHYSIKEGLPASETYSVCQDKKGYIWIASDMGVSRFDGYNFKIYTSADGLTDNTIFKFHEDTKGRLWFCTYSGKICYYLNDTIYGRDFAINSQITALLGSAVLTSIWVDPQDTIYLATLKGVFKIIPGLNDGIHNWNKIEVLSTKKSFLISNGYISIEELQQDSTLVTRTRFNGSVINVAIPISYSGFRTVLQSINGSVFLFYENKSAIIDSSGSVRLIDQIKCVIGALMDNDSCFWVGQIKGGGVQLYALNDFAKPRMNFLKSLSVTSILKDRENGYWFTTLEEGIFYLSSKNFVYFENIKYPAIYNENSLHVKPPDKVWIIADKKLYEGDANRNLRETHPEILKRLFDLGYSPVWNVYVHSDGEIWISANRGIVVFDSSGSRMVCCIELSKKATGNSSDSRQLVEDCWKDIWSRNYGSLVKIDYRTKRVLKSFLIPARTETICVGDNNHILIGTVNGVYTLTGDSLRFLGDDNPVFKERCVDIKKWGKNIVCATRGAGLIILCHDSVYHVTTANGLTSNMCRSVFIDTGCIWISTNRGLNKIKIEDYPFRAQVATFNSADGLLSDDIEKVIKSGKWIWLLSKAGITVFNPEESIYNALPPPVYITGLKIDKADYKQRDTNIFSYSTNFIQIDFVGLTYKNAGKQLYSYTLEGYDTSWSFTKSTSVQFTKLPPGSYKFLVRCINNSGIASLVPATFIFQINAPFYKRSWFVFLLFVASLILILILSVAVILRIKRVERNKTRINRKIADLELQALRAQMNPHFIFNCLSAIRDFIVSNNARDAEYYLSSFAKLVRKVLDNSIRQNVPLSEEIDFLNLYLELEHLRFNGKFTYRISVDSNMNNQDIEFPSMILQPFVENAIKHGKLGGLGRHGELNISFIRKGDDLICCIEDNGIGLRKSLENKSVTAAKGQVHFLEIIREHVWAINQVHGSMIEYSITDRSDLDSNLSGTRAEIRIPVIKDDI